MSKPDERPVHVAEIKKTYKGKVHVSTYLRRTFREDGKVRHETVANISRKNKGVRSRICHYCGKRFLTRMALSWYCMRATWPIGGR